MEEQDKFHPEDYLKFAKSLLENEYLEKNPALCRSVVSRSYYAAFLTAREQIDKIDGEKIKYFDVSGRKRYDIHKQVKEILGYADNGVSRLLKSLRDWRNDADYYFKDAENENNKNFNQGVNDTDFALSCHEKANQLILKILEINDLDTPVQQK